MPKKILNILFLCVMIGVLLAGLVRTLCFPHDMNTYENRYAEKVEALSVESFLNGTFQSSMDTALSDQVHFAQYCKKIYNVTHSLFQEKLLVPIAQSNPDRYVNLFSLQLFGGTHLLHAPAPLETITDSLTAAAHSYNRLFRQFPDTEFYLYFIENYSTLNFETGEKVPAYAYLTDRIDLPAENTAVFAIDDFDTYRQYFFRTDHHWNYAGSYAAYLELLTLLGISEPALEPQETVTVSSFSGSKAYESGADTFSEPFIAHRFDFPEMTITINGTPADDYGNQTAYLNGTASGVSYSGFYGGDAGEIIFDTGSTGRGSLLVFGESFDNAVLKLLASHFDRVYSIDLRNYSHFMGKEFVLRDYLAEHDEIDSVLLLGSLGFYTSETFRLEG